ncbi:MAG TPA: glycosyltransferase family 4 protein [Gemmatimonadales bacterium]|nr:glycosyltransferase family 4 protein [Gemmatimonadales bacterium]
MQIVQLHLVSEGTPMQMEEERIGRGGLVWIPSVVSDSWSQSTMLERLRRRILRTLAGTLSVQHDFLLSALHELPLTLAVFHWLNEDSEIVVRDLNRRSTPYVIVNHFQNTRLVDPKIRKQIAGAVSVSGVSSVDVPPFLADRFVNVSDGIDAEFFDIARARRVEREIRSPLILLPSRVTEGKGHLEAVHALVRLSRMNVVATLAFAGMIENEGVARAALGTAKANGLGDQVMLLGELDAEALRDWYGASDIVILTTHSEGLGRVLLEAQAMQKPVVAYDAGGVRQAIADGETGHLVPIGDVEILAERIRQLLGDARVRDQMGYAGRLRVVNQFSLDALAERHETLYTDALALAGLGRK